MKKHLIIIGLAMFATLPAFAELTTSDVVSEDYMKNYGYSTATINATQKSIAKVNGEPLAEPVEKEYYESNAVVKGVRKFFMYIDPALDDHSFVNDHEIKTSPNYQDL